MLVLHRVVKGQGYEDDGRNEIVMMHPDAGRIVIRLFVPHSGRGVSVGIEAPQDVEIQRGELERAGVSGRKG